MSFSRNDILYYLRRLNTLAKNHDLVLEITFYGGSCLLLAYDYQDRALTKDIDAIVRPKDEAQRLISTITREENLPEDWLDQGVSQFLSQVGKTYVSKLPELADLSNIKVSFPSASYLIAMKIRSSVRSRIGYDGDLLDLKFLAKKTKLDSLEKAQAYLDQFFDDEVIPERAKIALTEVIDEYNKET